VKDEYFVTFLEIRNRFRSISHLAWLVFLGASCLVFLIFLRIFQTRMSGFDCMDDLDDEFFLAAADQFEKQVSSSHSFNSTAKLQGTSYSSSFSKPNKNQRPSANHPISYQSSSSSSTSRSFPQNNHNNNIYLTSPIASFQSSSSYLPKASVTPTNTSSSRFSMNGHQTQKSPSSSSPFHSNNLRSVPPTSVTNQQQPQQEQSRLPPAIPSRQQHLVDVDDIDDWNTEEQDREMEDRASVFRNFIKGRGTASSSSSRGGRGGDMTNGVGSTGTGGSVTSRGWYGEVGGRGTGGAGSVRGSGRGFGGNRVIRAKKLNTKAAFGRGRGNSRGSTRGRGSKQSRKGRRDEEREEEEEQQEEEESDPFLEYGSRPQLPGNALSRGNSSSANAENDLLLLDEDDPFLLDESVLELVDRVSNAPATATTSSSSTTSGSSFFNNRTSISSSVTSTNKTGNLSRPGNGTRLGPGSVQRTQNRPAHQRVREINFPSTQEDEWPEYDRETVGDWIYPSNFARRYA
jgi:hypothetical protein